MINRLNGVSAEGEGAAPAFAFTATAPASPASQSLDAAAAISPNVFAQTVQRGPAIAVQEVRDAKATIFQRVGSWLTGTSERVASLLEQPAKLHRQLPDTIDLPAAASGFVAAQIDDAIGDIAAAQHAREENAEPTELEEAIDEILGDWLG